MAEEKKLFFYGCDNSPLLITDSYDAILDMPLESFPHVAGCCSFKNIELLIPENIGKKFKLSILDPFEIDEVTYLGDKLSAVSNEVIHKELKGEHEFIDSNEFHIFQTHDGKFVITRMYDVEPLF